MSSTFKPTVFYDGGCPLCNREIKHYRRLRGADNLLWIDIAEDEVALMAYGLDKDTAMARFHVMDVNGAWQTGAYGFAELWSHLPAYRWLAFVLTKLKLLSLLDVMYSRFAVWRLKKNCHNNWCQQNKHQQD